MFVYSQVVLPEGSKNPSASVPFPVKQELEVPPRPLALLPGFLSAAISFVLFRIMWLSMLQTSFSYLDVVGRPTVVLERENAVPEHNVFFQVSTPLLTLGIVAVVVAVVDPRAAPVPQVSYGFSPLSMLAEPLMLVAAFFLLFVSCVAYLHADLSIRKS